MTRSQADELSAPVVRAYLDAEDEILRMIAEQLAADGDLSDTSKWRIRQLARAGALDRKAIEIIKSYMPVVSDETDELITAAAMSEIAYTDAAFQRAAADGIKGIAVEVPASRKNGVKNVLKGRVANGEISAEQYEEIIGEPYEE